MDYVNIYFLSKSDRDFLGNTQTYFNYAKFKVLDETDTTNLHISLEQLQNNFFIGSIFGVFILP